jgi:hypothetical protein
MATDGTQVVPITEKVRNYLNSSEGKDLIKSIAKAEFSTSNIQSEVRNVLSSYDGKKLVQSATSDPNVTQKIRDFFNTSEGRNMVSGGSQYDSGMEIRLEGKFDSKIESKFNSFCMNSNFKNHVLSIVQTQSYFDELCKQIFMENAIRQKIERLAPDSIKKEIKTQLREIIQSKFDEILVKELNKLVPQMVQAQCSQIVPRIATDTARTEAQSVAKSIVESMTPSLVSKEMHTQFPAYIQNHSIVQAIMTDHTAELKSQLRNTSEIELNRITGDDKHNILVKKHLEETDRRCQAEVANCKSDMDNQLQQNAVAFNSQLTGFGEAFTNQMNSNIQATNQQLYQNHQAVQLQIAQSASTVTQISQDLGVMNGNITKLANRIESLEKAKNALQSENDTIKSFIRCGAVAIIGIIAWVGYAWFNRGGPVMPPKIVYT